MVGGTPEKTHSFLRPEAKDWEISSMRMDGNDLLVRIFNAAGDGRPAKMRTGFKADEALVEELDGRRLTRLAVNGGVELSIPRFGIRTIRFINVRI